MHASNSIVGSTVFDIQMWGQIKFPPRAVSIEKVVREDMGGATLLMSLW